MSEYVKNNGLGAIPAGFRDKYEWEKGKCLNKETGMIYQGDQKQSNCYGFFGPPPKKESGGWGDVFDFAKGQFFGGGGSAVTGPQAPASASLTSSGILIPVVAAVGGLAILLIIAKKK